MRGNKCIYQPRKRRGKPRNQATFSIPDAGLSLSPNSHPLYGGISNEVVSFCIEHDFPAEFIESIKREEVNDFSAASQIKESELHSKFGPVPFGKLLLWRYKTRDYRQLSEVQCVQALQSLQNPDRMVSPRLTTSLIEKPIACPEASVGAAKKPKLSSESSSKLNVMKSLDWLLQFLQKLNSLNVSQLESKDLEPVEKEFHQIVENSTTGKNDVQQTKNVRDVIDSIQSQLISLIYSEFDELKKCLENNNKCD